MLRDDNDHPIEVDPHHPAFTDDVLDPAGRQAVADVDERAVRYEAEYGQPYPQDVRRGLVDALVTMSAARGQDDDHAEALRQEPLTHGDATLFATYIAAAADELARSGEPGER